MGENVSLEEVFLHKCYLSEYLKLKVLVVQSSLTLCNSMDHSPARLLCPWNSSHMSCHFLLQGVFPTQGLNVALRFFTVLWYSGHRNFLFFSLIHSLVLYLIRGGIYRNITDHLYNLIKKYRKNNFPFMSHCKEKILQYILKQLL